MTRSRALRQGLARGFALRGRASRTEFWPLCGALAALSLTLQYGAITWPSTTTAIGATLFSLVTFIALFSAAVRRAHDRGRSAWWLIRWSTAALTLGLSGLYTMIVFWLARADNALTLTISLPLIGLGLISTLRIIVVLARKGDPEHNAHGDPPA